MQIIIQAVVLRRIAQEPVTLSLYTERFGRITVRDISAKKQWQEAAVGDICYATLEQRGKTWFLLGLESVVTYAQSADSATFFWHHHLLDMYFYYVPLEQPSSHLFVLLTTLLQIAVGGDIVFKLFMAHFFSLLGYYVPEEVRWYRLLLAQLEAHVAVSSSSVAINDADCDYASLAQLDAWLLTTVSQHDHFQYLKTHQFLPQLYCTAGV